MVLFYNRDGPKSLELNFKQPEESFSATVYQMILSFIIWITDPSEDALFLNILLLHSCQIDQVIAKGMSF